MGEGIGVLVCKAVKPAAAFWTSLCFFLSWVCLLLVEGLFVGFVLEVLMLLISPSMGKLSLVVSSESKSKEIFCGDDESIGTMSFLVFAVGPLFFVVVVLLLVVLLVVSQFFLFSCGSPRASPHCSCSGRTCSCCCSCCCCCCCCCTFLLWLFLLF